MLFALYQKKEAAMRLQRIVTTGVTFVLALHAGVAVAVQVEVPGSANPNLAGRADGYSCCSGDSVPAQAAVEAAGLSFAPTDVLTFDVSGQVSFGGGPVSGDNPDGDSIFSMTNYGDGISAPQYVKTNALLGVFLGDASPTGGVTPAQMSFFDSGLGFAWLAPQIGQIFFIGDGLTSDSNGPSPGTGNSQAFIVPAGATRLFFGTCDGVGWYNNTGIFTVDVTATPRGCGDPAATLGINAVDALFILKVGIGLETCALCVCDTDGSGSFSASDALLALQTGVGVPVDLLCPACGG
jgi:hypothetical protein